MFLLTEMQAESKESIKRRVMMKKLTALLSTIVVTFTLCSTLARAETILIKPALLVANDISIQYSYKKNDTGMFNSHSVQKLTFQLEENIEAFEYNVTPVNEARNFFFEFSITFNDKLQQLIAFFTRDDDDFEVSDNIGNNSLSAKASIENCKKSG